MANGGLNTKRFQQGLCNVDFVGRLHSQSYCMLVVDILKYFIYTRGQIPVQYDTLCKELLLSKKLALENEAAGRTENTIFARNTERKTEQTADAISEWIVQIEKLFEEHDTCQIRELIFMLGPTCFNPKIVFNIKLPCQLFSKESGIMYAPMQRCRLQVLQSLIKLEETVRIPDVGITNVHLLVKMRNELRDEWFIPKPEFEPTSKGVWIILNLRDSQDFPVNDAKTDELSFKIHNDFEETDSCPFSECGDPSEALSNLDVDASDKTDENVEQFVNRIWYQAPNVVKGIKIKRTESF